MIWKSSNERRRRRPRAGLRNIIDAESVVEEGGGCCCPFCTSSIQRCASIMGGGCKKMIASMIRGRLCCVSRSNGRRKKKEIWTRVELDSQARCEYRPNCARTGCDDAGPRGSRRGRKSNEKKLRLGNGTRAAFSYQSDSSRVSTEKRADLSLTFTENSNCFFIFCILYMNFLSPLLLST